MEHNYTKFCRPNNIGPGGLSGLPLKYQWYNGSQTNVPTDPYLPDCKDPGCILNGSLAYEAILKYHTTVDLSPDEVYELGWKNINIYC